jgi:hypothetical protein
MSHTLDPPIACTLAAGDFKARLAWIANLNTNFLLSHSRGDLTLELTYAPQARDEVRQMVTQERACCAFLIFELCEADDAVYLSIAAPERAREAAETTFAPFQAATQAPETPTGCGYCVGAAS